MRLWKRANRSNKVDNEMRRIMKHIKRSFAIFFIMLGMLLAALPGWCTTYYVNASGGSDGNSGTSEGQAFKTLYHVANSGSYSPGDTILLKRGEIWRERLDINSGGATGSPITYDAYGTGVPPLISGGKDSEEDGCGWAVSSSGTNEYYLHKTGGNPGYIAPNRVFWKATKVALPSGAAGSLNDNEWAWGDNDSLGYNTVYVRSNSGVPAYVMLCQVDGCIRNSGKSHIIVQNIDIEMSNGDRPGIRMSDGAQYILIQNMTIAHCYRSGMALYGLAGGTEYPIHALVYNCTAYDNGSHGFGGSGQFSPPMVITDFTIDSCTSYNNFTSWGGDGYGIKYTWVSNSTITNCITYDNDWDGINLDGSDESGHGNCYNDVSHNTTYNNGNSGILLELYSKYNDIHHNISYDNGQDRWAISIGARWHSDNNVFRYNIARRQHSGPMYSVMSQSVGNIFHNNVSDQGGLPSQAFSIEAPQNTKLFNNIILGESGTALIVAATDDTGFITDNNYIQSGQIIHYNVVTEHWSLNLAAYRALTTNGTNTTQITPIFEDPTHANMNYNMLQTSVSHIDQGGTAAGMIFDLDMVGNSVPQSGVVDIGPYEYTEISTTGPLAPTGLKFSE
jgi:Right handed beta helix region